MRRAHRVAVLLVGIVLPMGAVLAGGCGGDASPEAQRTTGDSSAVGGVRVVPRRPDAVGREAPEIIAQDTAILRRLNRRYAALHFLAHSGLRREAAVEVRQNAAGADALLEPGSAALGHLMREHYGMEAVWTPPPETEHAVAVLAATPDSSLDSAFVGALTELFIQADLALDESARRLAGRAAAELVRRLQGDLRRARERLVDGS